MIIVVQDSIRVRILNVHYYRPSLKKLCFSYWNYIVPMQIPLHRAYCTVRRQACSTSDPMMSVLRRQNNGPKLCFMARLCDDASRTKPQSANINYCLCALFHRVIIR